MSTVAVRILHAEPRAAGPLERRLVDARRALAERHRVAFLAAGATDVRIVDGPADDTPFGARLRTLVGELGRDEPRAGIVVLGSGALALATGADLRAFVRTAAGPDRRALANNRFSADAIAVSCADRLAPVPDLPADNALPRWLEEVARYDVADLRHRWRLGIDLDSPLDLALVGAVDDDMAAVLARLAAIRHVAADRRAELVVAGRTSAATLRWLETRIQARARALIEERGLRARTELALRADTPPSERAPRSVLGLVLDDRGPESLGDVLAQLGDAAVVDTRVLLAHRLGVDESAWPRTEDRFASDLLLHERISDPWLRALTRSAATASIPVALGGHTLVGPGLRLVLQ